jgi:hypothetical protein
MTVKPPVHPRARATYEFDLLYCNRAVAIRDLRPGTRTEPAAKGV